MEKVEENEDIEDYDHDEPVGCSFEGVLTFSVGLVAGTFSALICKVCFSIVTFFHMLL